jgi:hypothetical protein
MAMLARRTPRTALFWLLAGAGSLVLAADAEEPDMEFLEYLGQWEESDEEWVMIDHQISLESDERTDPAPQGEESTEKDDEQMARCLTTVVAVLILSSSATADEQGVAWNSLSAEQQQVLDRFADSWDSLPADRQQRLSRGADRWSGMTPGQREKAQMAGASFRMIGAATSAIAGRISAICHPTSDAGFVRTSSATGISRRSSSSNCATASRI